MFTYQELLKITGATAINPKNKESKIHAFTYDSRQITPGMGFVPVKGTNVDGHRFIASAVENGASVYFSQYTEFEGTKINYPNGLLVQDTLQAFYKVARYNVKRYTKDIIGITGSAGKTTTKFLTGFILDRLGITNYVPPKNLNGKYGTPLALANMQTPADVTVLEYAAGEKGEIRTQLDVVKPTVAILISITLAHSEFLGSVDDIAREKGTLFEGTDNHVLPFELKERFYNNLDGTNLTFGYNKQANAYIHNIEVTNNGVRGNIYFNTPKYSGMEIKAQFSFFNKRIFENLAAILLALELLNIDWQPAIKYLPEFEPYEGRGNILRIKQNGIPITVINEAYNANPLSMANAISTFDEIPAADNTKKLLVLGDMKELGEFSDQAHLDVIKQALASNVDLILVWGSEFKEALSKKADYLKDNRLKVFKDIAEIRGYVRRLLDEFKDKEFFILVKASNAMKGAALWEDWT